MLVRVFAGGGESARVARPRSGVRPEVCLSKLHALRNRRGRSSEIVTDSHRLPDREGRPDDGARISKGETNMRLAHFLLTGVAAVGLAVAAAPASADPIGKGLVMRSEENTS